MKSSLINELGSSAFGSDAHNANRPFVLLFLSAQCPASGTLEQMMNALAPAYSGRLRFGYVNAAKAANLVQHYRIHSIPSLAIVHHESVLYLAIGVLPRRELEGVLDAAARRSCEPANPLPG
ncbi:MAG TPA: hypothetical protein GYA07_06265 [Verrucomicrobia bacterium]|nr:hypothetical protein [Verrucomicrobiota bacterium]